MWGYRNSSTGVAFECPKGLSAYDSDPAWERLESAPVEGAASTKKRSTRKRTAKKKVDD